MKILISLMLLCCITISCKKDNNSNANINENNNNNNNNATEKTITTWAHTFQPAILNCNPGDTIYFDLGGSHNAIEVSEDHYNTNEPTPIDNGFEFGYGESGFFVPLESKTYYYVCEPHLPEMKAKIIVE